MIHQNQRFLLNVSYFFHKKRVFLFME